MSARVLVLLLRDVRRRFVVVVVVVVVGGRKKKKRESRRRRRAARKSSDDRRPTTATGSRGWEAYFFCFFDARNSFMRHAGQQNPPGHALHVGAFPLPHLTHVVPAALSSFARFVSAHAPQMCAPASPATALRPDRLSCLHSTHLMPAAFSLRSV
jgi:hypothetical protein